MRFVFTAALVLIAASPVRAQTGAFVGIKGLVVDDVSGEPVIDATVKVVRGAAKSVQADADGRFALKLPAGEYELRAFYELYEGRKITGVVVRPEVATELVIRLRPDGAVQQEVVVEARADTRTESAVLEQRKKSAVVSDAVSAQEMSRTPDSNAGDAAKRIVSVTVQDNKAVLRGLGGRYSSTLLDGTPLPSPEPDDPQPPLDLFPTSVVANLNVLKTWSPSMPGTFAGGVLDIETVGWPSKRELRLKLGLSLDSVNTFHERPAGTGGSLDFLGIDDGGRGLPDAVPVDKPVRGGEGGLTRDEREKVGEAFSRNWEVGRALGLPNLSLGAQYGDVAMTPVGRLGWLGSLSYNRSESFEDGRSLGIASGEVLRPTPNAGSNAVLSALGTVGWQPTDRQEIRLLSLFVHGGENRAFDNGGFDNDKNAEVQETRLQWIERTLSFTQLRGDHALPADLRLQWNGSLSVTRRDEPDTRDLRFLIRDGRRQFVNGPGSAEHFSSSLLDTTTQAGATLTIPAGAFELKTGGTFQRASRAFAARRIRFDMNQGANPDPDVQYLPPDEMLGPDNIGPSFLPVERTLPSDSYDGLLLLGAGFGSIEWSVFEGLKIASGLRVEAARQTLTAGSPYASSVADVPGVDRSDLHVLPMASANWAVTKRQNLRAAWSYTLIRPRFRELAPFLYVDYARGRTVSGNPGLEDTRLHNADLRWEWFPGEGEVVAASLFGKLFDRPIERVVVPTSVQDLGFRNAAGAMAGGLELEGRVSIGRLSPLLADVRAGLNVSFIASRVVLRPEDVRGQSSTERPLQGQAPFIVNASLGWTPLAGTELALLYNVTGAKLDQVGADFIGDIYDQPIHRLDLSVSHRLPADLKLKASATNLLNQSFELREVASPTSRGTIQTYPLGLGGALSVEWSPG